MEWAVWRGLSVIPVQPFGKKKPVFAWKEYMSEPADPATVNRWNRKYPNHLWALVTGEVSQMIVLDFDGAEGLATMAELGLQPMVTTPSGGAHVWVSAVGVVARTQGYGPTYPGMEVKANGGKATFAGRRWQSMRRYVFHGENFIIDMDSLPAALQRYIRSSKAPAAGEAGKGPFIVSASEIFGKKFGQAVAKVHDGDGRNHVGHWLAQQLWWNGADEVTLGQWMASFRLAVNVPGSKPYEATEVTDTIRQVMSQPKRDPDPSSDDMEALIQKEVRTVRIRQEARQRVAQEDWAVTYELPPSRPNLFEELRVERPPLVQTIEDLHVQGGNTIVAAMYKTGKTTLMLNLLRSLVRREKFLGVKAVELVPGNVAFWNYELSERQMLSWFAKLGLTADEQRLISVWNLRGYSMPLLQDFGERDAVDWLRERDIGTLVLDPLFRSFRSAGGLDENSNGEMGRFLDKLDRIKERANVTDLFIPTHFGRAEERTRGATVIDDWCDGRWNFTKKDDARYLSAEGRDVALDEDRVDFNVDGLRLTLSGTGGRKSGAAALEKKYDAVMAYVAEHPDANAGDLDKACKLHPTEASGIRAQLVGEKRLTMRAEGKSKFYSVTESGAE